MPTRPKDVHDTADRYDPRSLQTKALERWERQKRVWDSVRDALLRDTVAPSSTRGQDSLMASAAVGSARNFTESTRYARERAEDFGMIEGAVPRAALGSNHVWESQLRQDDATETGTRLVQIGKAIFPYALYGIMKDPAALRDENPAYTRTVLEPGSPHTDGGSAESRALRSAKTRTAIRLHTSTYSGDCGDSADAHASDLLQTQLEDDGDSENAYYKQQLELFFPYVQQRFPHFLLPRDYMRVDGQPAPRMSPEEMKAQLRSQAEKQQGGESDRPPSAAPVQYFPAPQSVRLLSSRPGTGNINGSRQNGTSSQPTVSIAENAGTPEPYAAHLLDPYNGRTPHGPLGSDTDGCAYTDSPLPAAESDAAVEGATADTSSKGPALSLSTRELTFTGQAGSLMHNVLHITNTSTMTCYYSWEPVDLLCEQLEDRRLLAQLSARSGSLHEDNGRARRDARQGVSEAAGLCASGQTTPNAVSPRTHEGITHIHSRSSSGATAVSADGTALDEAVHTLLCNQTANARIFFRLAKPLNGVILPEETKSFPFAVRPPTAGVHTQTYELLTIPPLPDRILVKLVVVATSPTPTMASLARVVNHVLDARVRSDEARRVVQTITRDNVTAYEEADLRHAIRRCEAQQARQSRLDKAARDRQRVQWHRANSSVLDGLPYNHQVYAKLARLHANLTHTMAALGQPLRSGNKPWDSSVLTLMRNVHQLRDAGTRAVLYEGLLALLRAARASTDEDEPMEVLLDRAAAAATEQVVHRGVVLAHGEASLQQYTQETTAATLAGAPSGSRRPGSVHKRGANGAGGDGGNTSNATGAGARNGANSGGGANNGGAVGTDTTAPVVGSIRDTLRAPAPTTPAEAESLQLELQVLKSLRERDVRRLGEDMIPRYRRGLRDAIDAACDVPLIDAVGPTRLQSMRDIQQAPLMEAKASLELPPPPVKATGRKK